MLPEAAQRHVSAEAALKRFRHAVAEASVSIGEVLPFSVRAEVQGELAWWGLRSENDWRQALLNPNVDPSAAVDALLVDMGRFLEARLEALLARGPETAG